MTAPPAAIAGTAFPETDPAVAEPRPANTVLLVEDNDSLASLFSVLLGRCNLRVLRARDGAGCLRIFAEHSAAITLVLMDCNLPDAHGGSLCHRLRAVVPGLPVLLTSGRKQEAVRALLAADGPTGFLAKPFLPSDAVREVRALLDQMAAR